MMRVGPTACGVPCATGPRPRRPGFSRVWPEPAEAGTPAPGP